MNSDTAISVPVIKKDHAEKADGSALFIADYKTEGMLHGAFLRSDRARAKILNIKLPELPDGYISVSKDDVPGKNRVNLVLDDIPVFAEDTVEYIGDPILMIAGPDIREAKRLACLVQVEYEDLAPVIDMQNYDTVFFDYSYGSGDIDNAFACADRIFDEEFSTGYQEQAYLETNGIIAEPDENGITVRGSIQCPYYVHGALTGALGESVGRVRVVQETTGGGFGGKEDFPSILACQAAVAALKAKRSVRVILDRREDMEATSKRHPSRTKYKAAVKDGRVTAMEIDVLFNAGAYTTLSPVVLQRGIICACGVYSIESLKVHGRAVKTNTVPTGAFRGFGAPQTFFAVETLMNHIADALGADTADFKRLHTAKIGDKTSTGGKYHFPVPIPEMMDKLMEKCDYHKKRENYAVQDGRFRRGIGMSLFFHGAGFTGSGERDIIKACAALRKSPDGRVEILAANSDIGQGLKTAFCKIVAHELKIPLEKVFFNNPDTDRVPDSGPTVASRSVMTVGELLRRAAFRLRDEWQDGCEQLIEEHFKEPDFVIPFDLDKFEGDAYPTYAWGANAVEIELDTLTGELFIKGAWGAYDVGTPIDEQIVLGQMAGGLVQGIGYACLEKMEADKNGRIRNASFSDYVIPTAVDAPMLDVWLHTEEYPFGPYGAKGAGELPLVGAAPACTQALEQAIGKRIHHIPFTAEDAVAVMKEAGTYNG